MRHGDVCVSFSFCQLVPRSAAGSVEPEHKERLSFSWTTSTSCTRASFSSTSFLATRTLTASVQSALVSLVVDLPSVSVSDCEHAEPQTFPFLQKARRQHLSKRTKGSSMAVALFRSVPKRPSAKAVPECLRNRSPPPQKGSHHNKKRRGLARCRIRHRNSRTILPENITYGKYCCCDEIKHIVAVTVQKVL